MGAVGTPELMGEARDAARYRGGHLQIIASAGAGKTEVVSQRVVGLLEDGFSPESIVAFTFTERAAASLKSRIEKRVASRLGTPTLDRLSPMFIGTIHSYCFRILQQHVPRYETFDVLDDHRLTAFLAREQNDLELKELEGGLFKSIRAFAANLQVVENELLDPEDLEDPFREIYERYLTALEANRFLTYGQIIMRAIVELAENSVFERVHGPLRHLIVDEYQDINPAQEALIQLLSEEPVHLCVVGDDDQSIYQWRGSDVSNIVDFQKRYPSVRRFRIEENRRSRPEIIKVGNAFSPSIEGRLPKSMRAIRPSSGTQEVVAWIGEAEEDEAKTIAKAVKSAFESRGFRFRDVAILCRGRTAFPKILKALEDEGIPVQPGGRTNLFLKDDADLFGRTMCWLVDFDWRTSDYGYAAESVDLENLIERYTTQFTLTPEQVKKVRLRLLAWKGKVTDTKRPANLVADFYELLGDLAVDQWDLSNPWMANRLGTLARCSQVLVDFEATRRRARPDYLRPGEIVRSHDRGEWYYKWLAIYINNWARGEYEDFEGEEDVDLDAVELTTVHQSKGLEWPLVFVPSLTKRRFPSSNTGKPRDWHVPDKLFDPKRYEGSLNDERRLLYVAMTRARDFLSLSAHSRITKSVDTSPFLVEVSGGRPKSLTTLPLPSEPDSSGVEPEVLEVTFSDLAAYLHCGFAYRLRRLLGFQPPIAPEIGYGKAVHHVLRAVAEFVQDRGKIPTAKNLDRIFNEHFYVPAANPEGHRLMKEQARDLVDRYIEAWETDLHRIWAVERPFELHLGDATVSGRADVIIHETEDGPIQLAIVDYKTAADSHDEHDFQLQVYTNAGRREGLVVENAYVHELRNATRRSVPVNAEDIQTAEGRVEELVRGLRGRQFDAKPGDVCAHCDVRKMCRSRAIP